MDDVFAIPSTVILSSFKNDDNTISVWEINSEEELDEAVLALTTCFKSLDTIDVVTLEEEYLDKVTVEYEYSDGLTPVKDLVHTHLNIKNLDYYKIGLISEYIIQRISLNKIKRYNLEDILTILRKAHID